MNDELPRFIDDDDDDESGAERAAPPVLPQGMQAVFPPFKPVEPILAEESPPIDEPEPAVELPRFFSIAFDVYPGEEPALVEVEEKGEEEGEEDGEEERPHPIPPPAPEDQSAFVNPAMARLAAARPARQPREPAEWWVALRTIIIVLLTALIVAFIFSYWTPESFFSDEFIANLQVVNSTQGPPTAVPSPLPTFASVQTIGIITGHSGPPLDPNFSVDPGAICDENGDGIPELTELEINTAVALRVANLLIEAGYQVEMLNEWDARLENYRAATLISIHTNTCEQLGFGATGFNVQAYERSPLYERDNLLAECIVAEYANQTGLARHFGSPPDLVDYHVFRKVSLDTPTVIIELGFMFADRPVLTQQPDAMAQGIYQGVRCFLRPPVQ